jgi:hypothetical protein
MIFGCQIYIHCMQFFGIWFFGDSSTPEYVLSARWVTHLACDGFYNVQNILFQQDFHQYKICCKMWNIDIYKTLTQYIKSYNAVLIIVRHASKSVRNNTFCNYFEMWRCNFCLHFTQNKIFPKCILLVYDKYMQNVILASIFQTSIC